MKILVAEDEPEILRLYKILLENEGHEVVATKDGGECMQAYKDMLDKSTDMGDPAFDLVILDHRMPKMTGLEVANEVLAMCPSQEILMVTAYGGELDLTDNLRKMKLIKKPFEVDELLLLISQITKK